VLLGEVDDVLGCVCIVLKLGADHRHVCHMVMSLSAW